MIETEERGQLMLDELTKNWDDPCFNQWEQSLLQDLKGKYYERLTKHQKAVITRLWDWWNGR